MIPRKVERNLSGLATYGKNIDLFVDRQPPMKFVEELTKPMHEVKPDDFGKREKYANEVALNDMYLDICFEDKEGLLETAYDDFKTFLDVYEMAGNSYPLRIRKGTTNCFEEYILSVSDKECVITSADTEGIRRALVYLEDLITVH